MPYCPQCHSEYREGFDSCYTCQVPLVDSLDGVQNLWTHEGIQEAIAGKELAAVAYAPLELCREIQQTLLAGGVPAIVTGTDEEDCLHGCAPRLLVKVPEGRVGDAVVLVRDRWQDQLVEEGLAPIADGVVDLEAEEITCPACGTTGKLTEEGECPECGLMLGLE